MRVEAQETRQKFVLYNELFRLGGEFGWVANSLRELADDLDKDLLHEDFVNSIGEQLKDLYSIADSLDAWVKQTKLFD